jgi:hypothetical protein
MTYRGSGDPARRTNDYYPEWLNHLADDVTVEGSVLKDVVQGADEVRTILGYARTLYDYQEFNFAGPYGENGFLEDYTATVHGEPIGSVVTVTYNADGKVQHIVVSHRPLQAVQLFSRLMGEKFAGSPIGDLYAQPGTEDH